MQASATFSEQERSKKSNKVEMSKEYKRSWCDQDFLCGFVVNGNQSAGLEWISEVTFSPRPPAVTRTQLLTDTRTGIYSESTALYVRDESNGEGEIAQLRLEALKPPGKQTLECPRWNSLGLCKLHPLHNPSFGWLGWLIWLVVVLSRLHILGCGYRHSTRLWEKNYWKVVAWWLVT